jgi:antirestriction protein ArdC
MITREVTADDFAEIAILAKQFKHYAEQHDIVDTFAEILNSKDHVIIAFADSSNKIIGYIHGFKKLILGNPISVEIGGIMIQQEHRR